MILPGPSLIILCMKTFPPRTSIVLFLFLILVCPAGAQSGNPVAGAAEFAALFQEALRSRDISILITSLSLPEAGLQKLVEQENESLPADDPRRVSLAAAEEMMETMRQQLTKRFRTGTEALRIMDGINAAAATITRQQARKSYWDPRTVALSLELETGEGRFTADFENLSATDEQVYLGPASRLTFRGYGTEDLTAFYIIQALQNRDAGYYADKVLAGPQGLAALMQALAQGGGAAPEIEPEALYRQTRQRIMEDFHKLLARGESEGISWGAIEKTWSGYSASRQGALYQSSIPFQFRYGGKEYRVVLAFCSQLASDPAVFLPGEFQWEGEL